MNVRIVSPSLRLGARLCRLATALLLGVALIEFRGNRSHSTPALVAGIAPEKTATISLDVDDLQVGLNNRLSGELTYPNSSPGSTCLDTSGDLPSSLGNSGTASDALTVPALVPIQSSTPSVGTYTPADAPNGIWNVDRPARSPATLTVANDAANDGITSNTVSLTGLNGTDSNPASDNATLEAPILAGVDLVLTTTESIDPVVAGSSPGVGNLVYTVTVTNNGPLEATRIQVTESLSFRVGGVGLLGFEPDVGTVAGNLWTIDQLAVGATATMRVALDVGPSTPEGADAITNAAEVTAVDQPQIATGDESATVTTSITREVDLVVALTESRDPVLAGFGLPGNLSHFVTVTNNGPSDASGVSLDLTQDRPPGATLDDVVLVSGGFTEPTWALGELRAGDSRTAALELSVPATAPGGADTLRTTGMVSGLNETLLAPDNDTASIASSVVSPASMTLASGDIVLDIQSALFKQTITVTNNNPVTVPSFRVLVSGLPGDVSVYNAQGESGGSFYLLYTQPLEPGASIDLVVEYFQPDTSGGFDPSFTIEPVDSEEVSTATQGAPLERIEILGNRDILLEFASTPGGIYTIQYSQDGQSWFNVVPSIMAGATRTQWIDNGPPKTPSHPSSPGATTRLYRVVTRDR